jgi:hypothetical protein
MIHPRIHLVSAEVVATMRGVSREQVYELVDGGAAGGKDAYLWVFNVGTFRERELRFWAQELREPAASRGLSLDEVVHRLVPRRDLVPGQFCGLPNWQVGELLRLRRQQLLNLRQELQAVPRSGGIYIPRPALENFFKRRWLFAGNR